MKENYFRKAGRAIPAVFLALVTLNCVSQSDTTPAPVFGASLVGGWSYQSALFACFNIDYKAGFGDHKTEALTYRAKWDDGHGVAFSDGKIGTWQLREDGKLEVYVKDCQIDCIPNPVIYTKDDSLGCGE